MPFLQRCILLLGLFFTWFCLGRVNLAAAQSKEQFFSKSSSHSELTEVSNYKTVYLISGLAADKRLFDNLTFPPNIKTKHVGWLEPLPAETMDNYCRRMAGQIDTTQEFALVGISFGGMVAVEMNKFIRPQKTILISSIVTAQDMPSFYRFVNRWRIHKAVPGWVYKHFYQGAFWFFNPQNKEERNLVVALMDNASKNLLNWSIDQLVSWKNEVQPENVFVIAGNHDRVFSHERTKPNKLVKGGTHMMVYSKPEVISQVLTEQFNGKIIDMVSKN